MKIPTNAPEQIIPLSQTTGMLRRLAAAELRHRGSYFCMVDGKRTEIVRDGAA